MSRLRRLASFLYDLIPHFETQDWAAEMHDDGSVSPVKTLDYVQPGEVYDGIITVRDFVWFGVCFGGGGTTTLKTWANPHDKVRA